MNFEPLRNRALRDSIASAIRAAIASGELRPGDPVPEAQIAEQMGVSRSPVREAFRKLEEQGLLVTYPHRGTYVAQITEQDARDIYQLRTGLEGLAARWTVEQGGGPVLVEKLQRLVTRMETLIDTDRWSETADLDAEFHDTVVASAGNTRLYQIWRSIDPFVWMMVGLIRAGQGAVPARLIPEHAEVVTAIESGDPRQAEDAVRHHIVRRREIALSALYEELSNADNSTNGSPQAPI
jgi:DNA-binding GntR family transcriptional regulator